MAAVAIAACWATKDRTKTVPTLRASAGASSNNGTDSVTVVVSTTAQVGDLCVFAISSKVSTAPTVSPAGAATWEYVSQAGDSSSTPFVHVFTRRLVAGDVSSDLGLSVTFSFAAASTDGVCGGVLVVANTSGFSVRPVSDFESNADVTNAHQIGPPPITGMGAYDLYAGVAAALPSTSTGTANATLSTAPSGCTIASGTSVTALRAGGTAGTVRGQAMWTGPTHAARVETLTYPATAVFTTALSFAFAPIPQRFTATQQGPPSLSGLEVDNYSNSSGSCVVYSQSDITRGCNTYRPWPERVAGAFGPVNAHLADGTPKSNNMAMGGARAPDICTAAFGTFSYTSVRAGANNAAGQTNQYNPQVLTRTALPGTIGLFTTDLVGNDFLKLGTDDLTMKGTWNAVDAVYRLLRAGSAVNVSGGSHTYGGTWTDTSSDGYMGGAAKKTTVAGSTVSIAITGQTEIDLVLIGYDDSALGVIGSAFSVTVDGVTQPTSKTITLNTAASLGGGTRSFTVKDTTSNAHQNSGAYKNYKFCQVVIPITLPNTSAHTVVITPTIAGGSQFEYNGYLIPAATPPWIVSNAIWRFPNATYTAAPYSFASAQVGRDTADWFNQIVAQALGQFDRTIYFDPGAWGTWDSTPTTGDGTAPAGFVGWDCLTHVSTGDQLHQSSVGHSWYAAKIIRLLNERIANPSTPYSSPASLLPATVPATFSMVGTRDFTVTAGNQTFAIEGEGSGGGGGGGAIAGTGKGAGGGAYAKKNSFTYSVGAVLRIYVPPGGPGGTSNGSVGVAGTAGTAATVTYISGPDFAANTVLMKADFGTGGGVGGGSVGAGGLTANCIGDVKTAGTSGSTANGGAGAAPLGGAGGTYPGSGQGVTGSTYGGGGSGVNNGAGNAAGPGAQGVVKFT